jgi:thiosulfate/3-mercaptopyruvate sulfurtransferase
MIAATQHLVSATQLATLVGDPRVLVIDCRFDLADPDRAARDYADAHVPGAVFAHLDHDLSGPHRRGAGRHPLPDATAFSATLSRWGWQPDRRVIVYDAANGALAAARLWWLLRFAGQPAAVLDGGLDAWRSAGFPLESGGVETEPTEVRIAFDPERIASVDEVARARTDPALLLLDARAAPRYRGDVEPLDTAAGHVPGARNRPFGDNLQADGRFKPATELAREFASLLGRVDPGAVVHMCGSGVTACHNLLAMEHAGLAGSRLFAPSWSGWIEDPAHPVAVGNK